MKKIFIGILSAVCALSSAKAQQPSLPIPANLIFPHYQLMVGWNSSTVVILPAPIIDVDRGNKNLITQKQPGVPNVLKIKANHIGFLPTNLHIFTSDGRIFAFDVTYATEPPATTFDLSKMALGDCTSPSRPTIVLADSADMNRSFIKQTVEQLRLRKPFFSLTRRNQSMKVTLESIYYCAGDLYIRLCIANQSNLPYPMDFTSLSLQDTKKTQRASIQQRQLVPLYTDPLSIVSPNKSIQWFFVVHQLTVPEDRRLVWELYEKDGGRQLKMRIKNKILFKARPIDLTTN